MKTLEIQRKNTSYIPSLKGQLEIKSFKNANELTKYFMNEFADHYDLSPSWWETEAKKWFDKDSVFSDDDTIYYFGNHFTIKLAK